MGNYVYENSVFTQDIIVDPDDGMMVYILAEVAAGGTSRIYLYNGHNIDYDWRVMIGDANSQSYAMTLHRNKEYAFVVGE